MPSLIEKMQPWTQTHSLIRRSWSSSSTTSPQSTASSTTSLLSSGGGGSGSSSTSGGSCSNNSSSSGAARVGGGTGSGNSHHQSLFGKICGGGSSSNNNNSGSSSNNNANSNGSRPKRKTPILSTCMSNWVKFDHDCQKPLHCAECESNQERNRKVLFASGGNVLISTGGKGKVHRSSLLSSHHRSHHHNHLSAASMSEPTSPTGSASSSSSSNSSSNNAFSGEVVSWENVKNKSSFKIVINVPYLDMSLFQNDNIQVEIVCNKNKMATGKDFEIVQRNRTELRQSGWYWEGIDSEASMEILESALPGAFIIRDSADPRFLYSLSVQTERGPTSVRLTYRNGKFSLDADEKLAELLPKFDSVIRLIEHYVNGGTKVGKQVWVDPKGNMHSTVKLTKAVRKDVGSLKHLTRVAINRHNLLAPKVSNSSASSTLKTTTTTSCSPVSPPSAAQVSGVVNTTTTTPTVNPTSTVEYKNVSAAPTLNHNCGDDVENVIPTVADLRLPLSLQSFMQEYPYNL